MHMIRKSVVFLVLTAIALIAGCLETSSVDKSQVEQSDTSRSQVDPVDINKSQGIYNNADRLYDDYKWKLNLVDEIQNRTDALGTSATKEMYVEWKRRNNEAIEGGERLATYITENRNILDQYWTSDILVLIAKNKVTFERDNQALEQTINSLEKSAKLYSWRIDYYGFEGGRELATLTFENMGQNLSDVKFSFMFYTASGRFYNSESLNIGDVVSGKIVRKKVSLPVRRWGTETWSKGKLFVYINKSLEETWVYENEEWKEQNGIKLIKFGWSTLE